jgi:catechol 2,3-dioxygenase-like lactoylglutathione lyase family enzyme
VFLSLDFIYISSRDFDATLEYYTKRLGAELVWKVRGMGTVVAHVKPAGSGPALLLSEHLEGAVPILIYRVDNFKKTVAELTSHGVKGTQLEIPHGPCFSFEARGGQRLAIYELVRPEAATMFEGRVDP